ncbi:MAG: hypothetical protein EPO39_08710 [Candidatus Manganitrophaceae bacterium]|nr:MAG: hypothetical protein EPO39_08710 [Candidatus Manganitrophaceae bacterium]
MTTKWTYPFVKEYLRFVRKAFEITRAGGQIKIRWSDRPMDLRAWRKEFIDALDRRITKYGGLDGRGRKFDPDWQLWMRRDRHRLEDIRKRVRVYQFETKEMRRWYGHLLAHRDDF